MEKQEPTVVIIGGGFGGLATAQALSRTRAHVILIDRNNHNVFQPLLYQVATAVLSPNQIGATLRVMLRQQPNATVVMGEVTAIDKAARTIQVNTVDQAGVTVHYDYLIVATGARHSYFGHDEFEQFAPGLKSISDAIGIRNRVLAAFEQAETEQDPERHQDLLTFVLVGGGPTGTEMAAALAIFIRETLASEFRRIDPRSAKIILVDASARILSSFAEELSASALRRLHRLGVEVRLGKPVEKIDAEGVLVDGERIASKTVIWTAGVTPSPAGRWLAAPTDRAGRVQVLPDVSIPDHPEVFVIGDTASMAQDGKPLPGVAQVAIQQGRYVAKVIDRRIQDKPAPKAFRYFDKGNMAVVGKGFAVLQVRSLRMSGFFAYLAWALIHLQFLQQQSLRISVFTRWVWTVLSAQRGSRLILRPSVAATTAPPGQPVTRAG